MKDEVDDFIRITSSYGRYFDKIYVTVTEKNTYDRICNLVDDAAKIEVSYFRWIDHFGKARLYNQSQIKTDYWMWIDMDDEIVGAQYLPNVTHYMSARRLDLLSLQYIYHQTTQGETDNIQWRERIMKNIPALKWADISCHEFVDSPYGARFEQPIEISIKHRKSEVAFEQSLQRNKRLLEKDWRKKKNFRTAFYLGKTYQAESAYDKAITMFRYAVDNNDMVLDEKFQAYTSLAEVLVSVNKPGEALWAADQAINIDPSHPEPWYQKLDIFFQQKEYGKAAAFADIAITKQPSRSHMLTIDPTRYLYKGLFLAAQTYLALGNGVRAYELFEKIEKDAPHFAEALNSGATNWSEKFKAAADDHQAIDHAIELYHYFVAHDLDRSLLFNSLPQRLFQSSQLRALRNTATPPTQWPHQSIAYFAGESIENWGPENIGQGLGGSEESVVYLCRELAKLGWAITVYCQRDNDYIDTIEGAIHPIIYKPWTSINIYDSFDVFISSRHPGNVHNINARVKLVDLHDAMPADSLLSVTDEVDVFMVKSLWHRTRYPMIADDKFAIIGNGILKEHFSNSHTKNRFSAGYFSSYDRGLETLLDMWPEIVQQVPEASLDIYYGWELFDELYNGSASMLAYKQRVMQKIDNLRQLGVTEHGRVGHTELARAMQRTAVWLYPTECPEVFCITALKTAEAGMQQVITKVGALPETAPNSTMIAAKTIYSSRTAQKQFVSAAVSALTYPKASTPINNRYWSQVAQQWANVLANYRNE